MTTEIAVLNPPNSLQSNFLGNIGNRPNSYEYKSAEEYFANQKKKSQTDGPIIINMADTEGVVVKNKAIATLMMVSFLTNLVLLLLWLAMEFVTITHNKTTVI